MIATLGEFEQRISALDPEQVDFVLRADDLVAALSQEIAPLVYEPILRFFEAHPRADCGAPGTFVHHVEDYYPNYVVALRQSVSRAPSYNGVLMLNRILNSKISDAERVEYLAILRSVISNASAPDTVRSMAKRFLDRQA
jgi:hypothetical protein